MLSLNLCPMMMPLPVPPPLEESAPTPAEPGGEERWTLEDDLTNKPADAVAIDVDSPGRLCRRTSLMSSNKSDVDRDFFMFVVR